MLAIQNLYVHLKSKDPKLFEALDKICNSINTTALMKPTYNIIIPIKDLSPGINIAENSIISGDVDNYNILLINVMIRKPILADLSFRVYIIYSGLIALVLDKTISAGTIFNRSIPYKMNVIAPQGSIVSVDITSSDSSTDPVAVVILSLVYQDA